MVNLLKFFSLQQNTNSKNKRKSHTALGQKVSSPMYSTFEVHHNCQKPVSVFSTGMLKEPVSSNE